MTAPLKVTLENGECYTAANWSLGGLRIDAITSHLPEIGQVLNLVLELPFQGFDISFDVQAEVVRTVDDTGTIGAKFVKLSERAHDLMGHFIEDLIRGKMATIEDTICRIDVPVTPISTQPDANPASDVPIRRWPIKTILMTAIYIVLGISVFSYLALLIYSYTTRIEVTSAIVSAPLVHVSMPIDGKLIPVALKKDAVVRRGQKLARVVDPKVEAQISDLRIEMEKHRRDLIRARERLRIESDRMKLYQVVNRTERQVAKAKVAASREALSAIDVRYERLVMLRKKGLIQQSRVDTIRRERGEAEARMKSAQLELERAIVMDSVSDRRHFNQQEFVADLDLLALAVEEANSQISLTSMKLERLERTQDSLVVAAPFRGRIISVNAVDGMTLLRGKNIVTLEKISEPEITAFLDQNEITYVGMNDDATVYLPALGRNFTAKVQSIDRSSASLRLNGSHYAWSDDRKKSASVGLRLQVPEEDRHLIRGGLPAVVIFSKRMKSTFHIEIANALQPREL